MNNTTIAGIAIVCLLVGLVGGFYLDTPDTEYVNKTTIEYINNTVEVEVEVLIEDTLLDDSLNLFLEEYEDEDRFRCDGIEYDFEEVEVRKVYDDYSVNYDDEDTTIDFEVKLKYNDGNDKCYKTFDVNVFYEEDEDPSVSY